MACWREALLAQKVLAGETKGYRNHPQLQRFRAAEDPMAAIGAYLEGLAAEAAARGYAFNTSLIRCPGTSAAGAAARLRQPRLPVHSEQLSFELRHLIAKLAVRDPAHAVVLNQGLEQQSPGVPDPHPLFTTVEGPVEDWERPV